MSKELTMKIKELEYEMMVYCLEITKRVHGYNLTIILKKISNIFHTSTIEVNRSN